MDEVTLTLSSPMTEEEWDMIADYDFNCTNEITFHTKHGKTVRFIKESVQPTQSNDSNTLNALDCISRQDAIAFVCRALHYNYEEGYAVTQMLALPSAQPERKKGKWNHGLCSVCGYDWGKDAPIVNVPPFCPNCGCEMERRVK